MIPLGHTETRLICQEHNNDSSQCILALVGFNLLILFSVSMEFLQQVKLTAVRVMEMDISWSFFPEIVSGLKSGGFFTEGGNLTQVCSLKLLKSETII